MKDDFWGCLEEPVSEHRIVVKRPKDSYPPDYPGVGYPLDYSCLEGTTSGDNAGKMYGLVWRVPSDYLWVS